MIQSTSARTRLLPYGVSTIALMASMTSPAFAQTAGPVEPGNPQCPIVEGVITCSGDVNSGVSVYNGIGAPSPINAQELRLVSLTAPISTPSREAVTVTNLDLNIYFDQSVDIRAGRWGGVVLRDGDYTFENDGKISFGGYAESSGTGALEVYNSSAAITNNGNLTSGFSGTLQSDPAYDDPIDTILIGSPVGSISIVNNGLIERQAYEGSMIALRSTDASQIPWSFVLVNNGRMVGSPPPNGPSQYASRYRSNAVLLSVPQYRSVSITNNDLMNGDIVLIRSSTSTGVAVGTPISIVNSGTISGDISIASENIYSGCYLFSDSTHRNCPLGDASRFDIDIVNSGTIGEVRIKLDSVASADVDIRSTGASQGIAVLAFPAEDSVGPFNISVDNRGPISGIGVHSFTTFGRAAIDLVGWGTTVVNNSGDLSVAECNVQFCGTIYHGIRAAHYLPYFGVNSAPGDTTPKPAGLNGFEQVEGVGFQAPLMISNSGRISVAAPLANPFQITTGLWGIAHGDLTITNSGVIVTGSGFQTSRPQDWYQGTDDEPIRDQGHARSVGIVASGWTDITLNSSGAITVDGADGVGIDFSLQNLRQDEVDGWGPIGFLPGYVRADDLGGQARIEISSDVTATGDASVGIYGDLGRTKDMVTPQRGEHVFEHDDASAHIIVHESATVRGGTGIGSGIFLQGAGTVTLENAGIITSAGNADSGGVLLGARTYNERYNYRSAFDSDERDELAAYVIASGLRLSLVDSVNTGTIASAQGHGILVANGSITNFVNSGVVRGGAGAITSSGRGQVTNLASGTIDGAVVLSGANSVLTNSGLVRLAGPGATASSVNGDWMQSAGRLELGLDDTLSVAGNMTLAGELGLTLGAPSSTSIIDVGGDLSIDARLDVTGEAGFGQGVYRLFDYGGALSGSGLTVATMPTGTSGTIQTAIAGQLNLVVGGGITPTPDIQFWDGAQTTANSAVDGGAGTWGAAATNWTDMSGAANAAWGSRFAVFQGTPATVTIAPEGVSASGLQFAVDGYRVEGGTLTLTAPATLRVGDASAAGAAYTATIASTIAGTGGIDKTDLGTLVLTGANSYTGGTWISGGTLAVSSDGALGAASGGLTFAGAGLRADGAFTSTRAIAVDAAGGTIDTQANVVTLSGSLTGSGALAKAGSGTLNFSGDGSAYTGTLTNRAGTLAIDGNLGGNVVSQGAALTLNGTVSGDVTVGAGAATIGTAGRVGGDLFATGSAAVRLDGAVTGNADIASVARLSGIGSIGGDLTLAGTVAPGNSVGTISVGGNATFAAGSVFDLELDADGSGDRLSVAGTTTIAGGTVRITTLDPELDYTDGSQYTFFTSTGGLTGTFDSLSKTSAFLDFILGYDGNRAFVTVDLARTFPDVAQTFNQRQASMGLAALDRTEGSDSLAAYNAILFLDEAPARAAFDASSGEIYPSLLQDLSRAAQARGRSLVVRSHAAGGEGWGLWGGATGRDGHVAGDGNAARSSFNGYGFDLGMDYRGTENAWAAGARVSWLKTNLQIDDRASSASGDGWALGGYARYGTGHAGFSASVAFDYAEASMDTARSMTFGKLSRTTGAVLDTNSIAASAELRYGLPVRGDWTVGPVASLDYGRGNVGGFAENGANSLDLSSDGARSGATRYGGGAFVSWQGEAGSFSLSAQYVTGQDRFADAVLTLDGAPTTPFAIRSPLRQADGALLDLTAGFDLGRGWRLGADASALLASGNNDLRGRLSIGWRF